MNHVPNSTAHRKPQPQTWSAWLPHTSLLGLLLFAWVLALGSLQSCSSPNDSEATPSDAAASTEQPPTSVQPIAHPRGCHPYAQGLPKGACLLPYPSSYYLKTDANTTTGFRVTFPDRLPVSDDGDTQTKADTTFFNQRDGFSPGSPIMALFAQRVDPVTLLNSSQTAKSLQPDSPVQLIEFGTQARVPILAEVDQTASDADPQVVLVRPLVRLKPNQRYAIVFLKTVKGKDGKDLQAPATFQKLWSGQEPNTPEEAAMAPGLQDIRKELEAAKVASDQICSPGTSTPPATSLC